MTVAMKRASFAIRLLFAVCLAGATFNHVHAALAHGLLWDYGYGDGTPLASRTYWGALTALDPLAAILLFAGPRAGIGLTAAIILSDVLHNTYYVAANAQWTASFYLAQLAFLALVIGLSPVAWRGLSPAPRGA